MQWKTKITELLGCKYPIVQGATELIGTWSFAAAVAESGAHGTITASICKTHERLRDDIRHCKAATSGTFGVNLSIGLCPEIDKMMDVCIEERVPIETSVNKPDALAKCIKDSGLPWIHKSARVKDAVRQCERVCSQHYSGSQRDPQPVWLKLENWRETFYEAEK